ncbi:T9SS type A sorting domain-containing protein [Flavobacterium psychrotrophum]|uniref:T9SS type A sorting domain-containing protein n=1 Tax=Flavobacterium psychrotrophum TaxID=2294119 RepID=UPI0013C43CA7|nr:T9SS type A sorting domain-containing protein [Flavobacterium psychrotrophum]
MKKQFLLLIGLLVLNAASAQYADPNFPKPTAGYGSDGIHNVAVETFNNPNFIGHTINIYHPADVTTPVPTIFYSHAYGGNDPENIIGVLNFIASKGYAVVFVPYQTLATVTVPERYANLAAGFRKATHDYPNIIDTTKVGFLGHSFGGAASFGISHELFTIDEWGQNGRFIYALAQWYAYNLSPDDLTSYPENTKVLFEIFNDDSYNDHRMAADIFNHITVPGSEKDFLLVPSSTVNGYTYSSEHNLPNTSAAFDALDYYAYYRLLDALIDYSFNGNTAGKDVALGHGSTAQVSMPGTMADLVQYNSPAILYPQDKYQFPCNNEAENPRVGYCAETADVANFTANSISIYPNPAGRYLYIQNKQAVTLQVTIFNNLGQHMGNYSSAQNQISIDTSALQPGVYFLSINNIRSKFIKS